MLKSAGFSMLEMVMFLFLLTLFLGNASHFIPIYHQYYTTLFQENQTKQTLYYTLQPVVHDLRQGNVINVENKQCVCIHLEQVLSPAAVTDAIYRFRNNNIEMQIKGQQRKGKQWRTLFDPKSIKIHHFEIRDQKTYAEIKLTGSGIKTRSEPHVIVLRVKYENRS